MKAKLSHLHIAPRKVRLVADIIRGKKVSEATVVLKFTRKKASAPLLKLLNSAVANSQKMRENLAIAKVIVNEGPKFKRFMPRARGQAAPIQKKTSHIIIELKEIIQKKAPAQKTKSAIIKKMIPASSITKRIKTIKKASS